MPSRNASPRSFSQSRYALPDRPGTRSRSLAVGCGPRVRSTIPVSSFGPRRRGSRWCQMCSSTPRTCTFSKRTGSFAAMVRRGWTWDHTVFQVVPSCRARSEEHTSELQSRGHLVCRLLLENKIGRCTTLARGPVAKLGEEGTTRVAACGGREADDTVRDRRARAGDVMRRLHLGTVCKACAH